MDLKPFCKPIPSQPWPTQGAKAQFQSRHLRKNMEGLRITCFRVEHVPHPLASIQSGLEHLFFTRTASGISKWSLSISEVSIGELLVTEGVQTRPTARPPLSDGRCRLTDRPIIRRFFVAYRFFSIPDVEHASGLAHPFLAHRFSAYLMCSTPDF